MSVFPKSQRVSVGRPLQWLAKSIKSNNQTTGMFKYWSRTLRSLQSSMKSYIFYNLCVILFSYAFCIYFLCFLENTFFKNCELWSRKRKDGHDWGALHKCDVYKYGELVWFHNSHMTANMYRYLTLTFLCPRKHLCFCRTCFHCVFYFSLAHWMMSVYDDVQNKSIAWCIKATARQDCVCDVSCANEHVTEASEPRPLSSFCDFTVDGHSFWFYLHHSHFEQLLLSQSEEILNIHPAQCALREPWRHRMNPFSCSIFHVRLPCYQR